MLKGKIIGVAVVVLVALVLFIILVSKNRSDDLPEATTTTTTPTTGQIGSPAELSFTGKVLEVDGDSILMDCQDKDKFDTVWVNVSATAVTPQVGEKYTVVYEDLVMPSLPPRITAVRIEKT